MLQIQESEFRDLVLYIKASFGINLENKRQLVEGRLGGHVLGAGFTSFGDYFDHVCQDASGRALSDLVSRLTTNHTCFFREQIHFDFLSSVILPELEAAGSLRSDGPGPAFLRLDPAKADGSGPLLRIWSAGCSTGEEPYSIAIALHEYFSRSRARPDIGILATDISARALAKARDGLYPASVLADLPPGIAARHFVKKSPDTVEVAPRLRSDVVFRSLNLIQDDYPLRRKFHVIFCRNVMIYFDQPTRERLVQRLFEHTEPGGYLLIGHAETVNRDSSGWQYIRPAIYRKPL